MIQNAKKSSKGKKVSRTKLPFEDRMEEIYDKAAMLIAQNGYVNTSMNQIANEVKLKKAGLYHYIKDKETLLFNIINRTLDIFLVRVRSLRLEGLSPEEKLKYLIREYTTTLVQHFNGVALMLLDSKYLRPKLRNIILSKRMKYENFFYSAIEEGISKKTFVNHDDKETLGFLIIGGIFNYYLWHPSKIGKDTEKKIDRFSEFFLNGLLYK